MRGLILLVMVLGAGLCLASASAGQTVSVPYPGAEPLAADEAFARRVIGKGSGPRAGGLRGSAEERRRGVAALRRARRDDGSTAHPPGAQQED
jgi:hypothetical protein